MTATGEPRVSVNTDPNDPDETDEFPGCVASVLQDGQLVIYNTTTTEAVYYPGEWQSVYVVAADADE